MRVAVLGAGIMGTCTALCLARRGFDVTVIDAAVAPLSGASRWNEGKIHLGYLYAADPSLETARRVIPGGLAFADRLRDLLQVRFEAVTTPRDDIYLIHRESVVAPDVAARYFDAVSVLVRTHPDAARYLADASHASAQPLARGELEALADTRRIVAGFRVPERSVRTTVLADALVQALHVEPGARLAMSTRVGAVTAEVGSSKWRLETTPPVHGSFDLVVNALWEGRLAIDRTVGVAAESPWSNRYRVSLFVETVRPVHFPSVVVATGPFGDIKNYDGRHFYISWYPAGLLVESHDLTPSPPDVIDAVGKARIVAAVREGITTILPGAAEIFAAAGQVSVEGGWVFAHGQGSLGDPAASLHRRDRFGVHRRGTYISVDTGKYSTAPWLAWRLAAEVAGN